MNDTHDTPSRKLIDRLVPNEEWGPLRGLLCITYDLDADFFELDFLPSVLGLAARSRWATRIAIEKRLSELDYRPVIMSEARRYRSRPRSLQLEVIPVPSPHGCALHAKLTLLVFDRAIRLIVGSANLTERGYRRNREAVAVLTASEDSPEEAIIISNSLRQGQRLLSSWLTDDAHKLVHQAQSTLQQWLAHQNDSTTEFCWSSAQQRLWQVFLAKWPTSEIVRRISIVSPFWSENAGATLSAFVKEIKRLGVFSADSEVRLLTDAYEGSDGKVLPVLPSGYAAYDWASLGIRASAQAVNPHVSADEVGGLEGFIGQRDLHAKIVILHGVKHAVAYLGSANFTAHGWGFFLDGEAANVEAGLIISCGVNSPTLRALLPEVIGAPVDLTKDNLHALTNPERTSADAPWPDFITAVLLSPARNHNELELVIRISPKSAPTSWSVKLPSKEPIPEETLLDFKQSTDCLNKASVILPLSPETLTRLLIEQEVWIHWRECPSGRPVPLNVVSSARDRLPISPGNNRIDETHLISYYQGKLTWEELFPDPDSPTDGCTATPTPAPAVGAGVDKSKIQSYQVREFVEALAGIENDLREATHSERAMRLALSGPVSPITLAEMVIEAVKSGQRSPTAAGFQLVEILGCLNRASSATVPTKLSLIWKRHVADTVDRIMLLLTQLARDNPEDFKQNDAFRIYKKAVLRMRSGARAR